MERSERKDTMEQISGGSVGFVDFENLAYWQFERICILESALPDELQLLIYCAWDGRDQGGIIVIDGDLLNNVIRPINQAHDAYQGALQQSYSEEEAEIAYETHLPGSYVYLESVDQTVYVKPLINVFKQIAVTLIAENTYI